MDDYLVDRVLIAVEQIPPGRVASYGDIAHLVGCGARRVGTIMRLYSHDVPYWRVVGAHGDPGGRLLQHFRPHWDAEGIDVKPNGLGCRIADHRADLDALERAYRRALAELVSRHNTPLPPLSAEATAALAGIGVTVLEHVLDHRETEFAGVPGLEPADVRALTDAVADQGWIWSAGRRDEQVGASVGSRHSPG